jgi:hypothetical protein
MTTMNETSAGTTRISQRRWALHDIALRIQAMHDAAVHLRIEHSADPDDVEIAMDDVRRHYADLGELLALVDEPRRSVRADVSTVVYRCGQLASSAVDLLTSPSSSRADRAGRLSEVAGMLRQECAALASAVREGRA